MSALHAKRWARRVDPNRIRRLYESDAQGMLDQDLLNDVGYGLYVRCQDLIEVSEAWRGRVTCRNCGHVIARRQGKIVEYHGHGPTLIGGKAERLTCDRCSWQITWADYTKSARGMDATGIEDHLRAFAERWPAASSPRQKLLLVDELIHAFHMHYKRIGSSLGCVVIAATEKQLLELLESLAYGTGSTPGLEQNRQVWIARRQKRQIQLSKSELQAIARELNVKGRSRMGVQALIEAIERLDPRRFEAWEKLARSAGNT
jgi:hypothetical protein